MENRRVKLHVTLANITDTGGQQLCRAAASQLRHTYKLRLKETPPRAALD